MLKNTFSVVFGLILASFSFTVVNADTRVVSQPAYDFSTAGRDAQSFTLSATTTIQSIALAQDEPGGCAVMKVGYWGTQVNSHTFNSLSTFSAPTAITGGQLYTGSVTLGSGTWVFLFEQSGCFINHRGVASLAFPWTEEMGAFNCSTSSPYEYCTQNLAINQNTFNICSDLTCSLFQSPQSGTGSAINWNLYYVPPPFSTSSVAIATSSSIWGAYSASTTLAALNGQCSLSGNIFSEALCVAASFLFVPNPTTINGLVAANEAMQQKFPFSWVFQTQTLITTLSASSTQNMMVLEFGLHDLGIGSTSPIGNVLPNFEFSTSTIYTYLTPSVWTAIMNLVAAGLWFGLGLHVYHTVRHRFHKI